MSQGRVAPARPDHPERVSFRILGPLTIMCGAAQVVLRPSKPTSLLAALLLHPNQTVSARVLQCAIWGDEHPLTKAALQTCALRLRQLFLRHGIADTVIETVPGGYRVVAGADSLDLVRFRTLARDAGAAADPETELSVLEEALALWHGPILANVPSELLQRDVVPRITEEWLRVFERLSDLKISLGRPRSALVGLWEATRSHPAHERFAEQLVESLYRTGRQADALAELRRVKTYLHEELGVDPGSGHRQLEIAILRGEQLGDDQAVADPRPVTTPGLTGRDGVARVIVDRIRNGGTLVVLTGPPGVGKTALAQHVAVMVAPHFPGGQRWVPMRTPEGRPSPDDQVARQLREAATEAVVGTADRSRHLVVLDDVVSVDQALPALGHPGTGASLLLTSRSSLSGLVARHGGWLQRIDALEPLDSIRLLTGMLGAERSEPQQPALRELAELCGHLPLALRIIGARLQTRPKMPLTEAVTWLREEPLARLALPGDPDMSLAGRLDEALERLDPTLREALFRLGAATSTRMTIDTCTDLLAAAPETVERLLEQLVDASWVEGGPRHYWMYDLLHAYARSARDRHNGRCTTDAGARRGPGTTLDVKGHTP